MARTRFAATFLTGISLLFAGCAGPVTQQDAAVPGDSGHEAGNRDGSFLGDTSSGADGATVDAWVAGDAAGDTDVQGADAALGDSGGTDVHAGDVIGDDGAAGVDVVTGGDAAAVPLISLFAESFDSDPFALGRWTVYSQDCATVRPGTVEYETGADGCGGAGGFISRAYSGSRCVQYTGPAFSTEGYTDLELRFSAHLDAGEIDVQLLVDGAWGDYLSNAPEGANGSWQQYTQPVSGLITGVRFLLHADSNVARRLDCIEIRGRTACEPAVAIVQQAVDTAVCPGQTVELEVQATGQALSYRWQKDGQDLQSNSRITGVTDAQVSLYNAQPSDTGVYRVVVNGSCGEVVSLAVEVVVAAEPTLQQQPQPVSGCLGSTARLSVQAVGSGELSYQWRRDGADLSSDSRITGAQEAALRITELDASDPGAYTCVVTDSCGSTTSSAGQLDVIGQCLEVDASGHYMSYRGTPLLLVGDSGTQCVMQNGQLDYRQWIDDCQQQGIRAIHLWSYMAARQRIDNSLYENRWGYAISDVVPWARTSTCCAADGGNKWNMRQFDESPDDAVDADFHYWSRLRRLLQYASDRDIVVGISVFFGGTKWDQGSSPFLIGNGGHMTTVSDLAEIESPGTTVFMEPWSDSWSMRKKTQWLWEQFAKKMIDTAAPFGNVFFVFQDEISYWPGANGQLGNHEWNAFNEHFQAFFEGELAGQPQSTLYVNDDSYTVARGNMDAVFKKISGSDKNSGTVAEFITAPPRPFFMLEAGPYSGAGLRQAIWTMSIAGGHYFFHADEEQEHASMGIMGYDPNVVVPTGLGDDRYGSYKRRWLGAASRFFNEQVTALGSMVVQNTLSSASGVYVLATPGVEYAVYAKDGSGSSFRLDLSLTAGKTLTCQWYDPRQGQLHQAAFTLAGGSGSQAFSKPDSSDWALHIFAD